MTYLDDSQSRYISRVVKRYDRDLFAQRNGSGIIMVCRKAKRLELVSHDEQAKEKVYLVRNSRQFVFALTDNWTTTGQPINWGGEVVLQRLKKHDSQANESLLADLEAAEEKAEAVKEKDMKNHTEAWLSDNHSKFKKAFGDVRTAGMNKSEKKRRMYDRNQDVKGI